MASKTFSAVTGCIRLGFIPNAAPTAASFCQMSKTPTPRDGSPGRHSSTLQTSRDWRADKPSRRRAQMPLPTGTHSCRGRWCCRNSRSSDASSHAPTTCHSRCGHTTACQVWHRKHTHHSKSARMRTIHTSQCCLSPLRTRNGNRGQWMPPAECRKDSR
jgi:hypothetical protein